MTTTQYIIIIYVWAKYWNTPPLSFCSSGMYSLLDYWSNKY